MFELVADPGGRRRQSADFRDAVSFRGDDLVFGLDTVLYKLGGDSPGTLSLRPNAAHDRMVALLAVAGRGDLPGTVLSQVNTALDEWRRGDRGLAAIRLAFAPLARLHDRDDAYRLVLAETALDAGVSPAVLLEELGYFHCKPLLKFDPNQPRVPAGSGAPSGRWTSGGAAGGATGSVFRPARIKPVSESQGDRRLTPVLFSETPADEERTSPEAEKRRLDIGGDAKQRIEEGRPLLPPTIAPGAPVARPRSDAPSTGGSSLAIPEPGIKPVPRLQSAPVDSDPTPSGSSSRADRGLACPAPQNDRPNGPNLSGDEFENSNM